MPFSQAPCCPFGGRGGGLTGAGGGDSVATGPVGIGCPRFGGLLRHLLRRRTGTGRPWGWLWLGFLHHGGQEAALAPDHSMLVIQPLLPGAFIVNQHLQHLALCKQEKNKTIITQPGRLHTKVVWAPAGRPLWHRLAGLGGGRLWRKP